MWWASAPDRRRREPQGAQDAREEDGLPGVRLRTLFVSLNPAILLTTPFIEQATAPQVRLDNPGTPQAQVFKICAELWREKGKLEALEKDMGRLKV